MRTGGELVPEELVGPVGYSSWWLVLAIAALVLVAAYYAVVTWWGLHGRDDERGPRRGGDVRTVRQRHLEELARIEREVGAGELAHRDGHQRLSATLRSYVAEVTPINAPVLALADLREEAPPELAEAIELMYPPEFAPDDLGGAERAFGEAANRARTLVETWS